MATTSGRLRESGRVRVALRMVTLAYDSCDFITRALVSRPTAGAQAISLFDEFVAAAVASPAPSPSSPSSLRPPAGCRR